MGSKNKRGKNGTQAQTDEPVLDETLQDAEPLPDEVADEAPEGGDDEQAPADPGEPDELPADGPEGEPEPEPEGEDPADEPEAPEAAPEAPAPESAPEPEVEPQADEVKWLTTDDLVRDVTEKSQDLRILLAGKLSPEQLAAWSTEQLNDYKEFGLQPALTIRGNWPYDARRGHDLKSWDASVFLDFLDGLIILPKSISEDEIYDEIYRRYRLPANWPIDDAVTYIKTGVKPAYTSNNVLVKDRTRDIKTLSQWTFLEIRTALMGEIESKFSKEELVGALRSRLGLSESYSAARLLESLNDTATEASVDNVLLKSKLDEFLAILTKDQRFLTDATVGKAHVMLYRAIRKVMQRDPQEFNEGWIIILDFINENYNKAFHPLIARKGYNFMELSAGNAATYEDLMTLMIHTRAPGSRVTNAKLYKLDQILRHVKVEAERMNVINFYASPY